MKIDKSRICFVSAKAKNDEYFDGIAKMGYRILIPYKDWNIIMRCLREAWFRLNQYGIIQKSQKFMRICL